MVELARPSMALEAMVHSSPNPVPYHEPHLPCRSTVESLGIGEEVMTSADVKALAAGKAVFSAVN